MFEKSMRKSFTPANPLPMAMQLGAAWRYNPYLGFLVFGGRGSSETYRTIMG